MATTNERSNQDTANTGDTKQDENRGSSAARDSALDDTTLDTAEGSERAKAGREDRATGSAQPMRKEDQEAEQGRS